MSQPKRKAYISSTRDRPRQCPVCLGRLDAVTNIKMDTKPTKPVLPSAGDVTVCAYCKSVLQFTRHNLRVADPEAWNQLDDDQRAILSEFIQMRPAHRPSPFFSKKTS